MRIKLFLPKKKNRLLNIHKKNFQLPYRNLREQYFFQLLDNPTQLQELGNLKLQILSEGNKQNYLYKYCNIDTALSILSTNSITLRPPDDFNDPFDCLASIGVWDSNTHFGPGESEVKYLKELILEIPEKYRLQEYQVIQDLRASYCFAVSCFSTSHNNRLMWSHYANNHRGVCLEFEIENVMENLHPCYYTDLFPEMNWKSNNINLSLLKEKAWQYEAEWRLVKTTTRPIMRMFGHIVHQVYNAIHQNHAFKVPDHYEWGDIQTSLMKKRETIYENERIIKIKPTAAFLGLLYRNNYTNELTGEKCKKIISLTKENEVPLYKMVAQPNNFELSYIITDGSPNRLY